MINQYLCQFLVPLDQKEKERKIKMITFLCQIRNLVLKLEKINFHRNQKEVEEIIKLKFFENKRDYLIKLKDNILSKDFSILGEAPKEDMMKMKKDLYIESIKESQ